MDNFTESRATKSGVPTCDAGVAPKVPDLMHEAMDRTHIISTMAQTVLTDHPGVKAAPEADRLINSAVEALEKAYQIIGRAMAEALDAAK